MVRIAIAAGELSGDRLGAGLIRAVRARRPDIRFEGIAGPEMQAAGCEAWFDSRELAVMGLAEVVRHLPRLRRVIHSFRRRLTDDPPDLYIGIDAPDFNLRILPRVHRAGIATIQYVCPSVWAWRRSRVDTLRAACDRVLCLLPFEPAFLAQHGVHGVFVGHPLADAIDGRPDRAAARAALGIRADGALVGILPGSRRGEVARLADVFAGTARWLSRQSPQPEYVVPFASPDLVPAFEAAWQRHAPHVPYHAVSGQAQCVMAAADVLLLASGTATLEAMLVNRPMVVAYRLSAVTWGVLKSLRLVEVPHVALPNLLAGERLVPEFLQGDAVPAKLGPAVQRWLEAPGERAHLTRRFEALGGLLRQGADERAADAVLELLDRSARSV